MHRLPFPVGALVALALLLAACAPTTTQSPAEPAGGEPSLAESEPAASAPGGGDGIPGTHGSVQYEVTGDYTGDGELPFVPEASYSDQDGRTYLSFTDGSAVLIISLSADGNVVQFGNEEVAIPAAECEFNLSRHDASGASGSFDCPDAAVITSTGTQMGSGTIRGTFDANM